MTPPTRCPSSLFFLVVVTLTPLVVSAQQYQQQQQQVRVAPGVPPQQYQPPPPGHHQQQQQFQQQQHHQQVPQQQHHQHIPQQQQHQVPVQLQGVAPSQHQQQQVVGHHPPPPPQQQQQQQMHGGGGGGGGHHHPDHGRLMDASNVMNERAHIQEHLDVPIDTSQMTEQELQFHYFKMHDADGNNKLDGCELVKSLIHWHDQSNHDPRSGHAIPEAKIFTDDELVQMIDPILQNDDMNKDGMIDYMEFNLAQTKAQQRAGPGAGAAAAGAGAGTH